MNKPLLIVCLSCILPAFLGRAPAAEPSLADLEQQFRELPIEARVLTGPLFWLHGDESRELLEDYVELVAAGGNGSLTTESRPHNDWLGPNWFRDVGICLEAAKKHNLKLWIFDEKWWPSQGVGGNVPPRYAAKQLEASAREVTGPGQFEATGYAGDRYIATVAGRVAADGTVEGATLVDLAGYLEQGALSWPVPEGRWKVMKFSHRQAPGLGQGGGAELSVDGMSRDCVEWYLQTVYQPHYDWFKDDFGKTIVGFFYDEPETRGDWGTELNAVLDEMGVDWKQAYVGYRFQLSGDRQAAARYQYLEARAETWGRTMFGGITRWCEARGVRSIGHFMEHSGMYRLQDFCAGDLMRVQKYSSMGGIDAVFSQFKMGQRVAYDPPSWQTPKLGSSITHAYGKPDDISMCEIFGARGQDLTYPEMKWWADHMHVSGVNFLVPHSFNPRSPYDTDCPPYFYNGGFEPRWPLYRVFADYTSRLSLLLTGGRHVCPVALLSPGQSLHVGRGVPIEQISESLQDALYDCDWIPYEVFENDITVARQSLELRTESYRVLIIPPVEVIPHATLEKAKLFFDQGGVVVGHGFLPSKAAELDHSSAEIAQLRGALWGDAVPGLTVCRTSAAGGRSYLLPEQPTPEQIQQVLHDAGIRPTLEILEGQHDHWLHVLHRVKSGRDVFFIANQNHLGDPRAFRFSITADGVPECWDAMRNEISAVPYTRNGRQIELRLTLEPNESVLLVFQPHARELPMRLDADSPPSGKAIPLTRDPVPPPPEPTLKEESPLAHLLKDASWVWYPEGAPEQSAPPGTCYFRHQLELPPNRPITKAMFTGTADNSFELFVNGADAGKSDASAEGWRQPVTLDVREHLKPGVNQFAIEAVNASNQPNPAGLLGVLRIEFAHGDPLLFRVDRNWRTTRALESGWTAAGHDDSGWRAAAEIAAFGSSPWGRLNTGQLTLSPVKADPFIGHGELPASLDLERSRVFLEMSGLEPEAAARVTVNGRDASGFIGKPLRLDVTRHVRPGTNSIRIEPFAPRIARLLICD
jgi:hypothetical protein